MTSTARIKGWPPALLTPVPLADRKRGDGDAVADFIEALCPQVKDSIGGRAGEALEMRGWQRELFRHLFARRPDGRYRHRIALVGMARKNGKSAMGSGIALHGLLMGPHGGEVYSCAADREQARIIFGDAKKMVEASPELAEATKLYRDAIEVPSTGSVYRVLSAEAFTKEGLSPTLVIYDELHAAPNDELWNVMTLAQAARRDALAIAPTTAGVKADQTGQDSTCYRMFQYAQKVASGEIDDPSFFAAWWKSADEADHRDRNAWLPANPGFGDLQDPEDFESAVKRTPENEFRTKRMNLWVNAQTAWLPAGAWDALPHADPLPDGDRTPVVIFGDGSWSGDSTMLVACTVEDDPRMWKVAGWEKQPTDTDDWRVPLDEVEATILRANGRWNVVEDPMDPYRWAQLMQNLAAAGLPIVEYPTSSPARMVPACAKFYDAVMEGKIRHDHDPQLARHIDNAVVKTDRLGPRIVKDSKGSPRKIDGAVCAVGAFDRASAYQPTPTPVVHFHF